MKQSVRWVGMNEWMGIWMNEGWVNPFFKVAKLCVRWVRVWELMEVVKRTAANCCESWRWSNPKKSLPRLWQSSHALGIERKEVPEESKGESGGSKVERAERERGRGNRRERERERGGSEGGSKDQPNLFFFALSPFHTCTVQQKSLFLSISFPSLSLGTTKLFPLAHLPLPSFPSHPSSSFLSTLSYILSLSLPWYFLSPRMTPYLSLSTTLEGLSKHKTSCLVNFNMSDPKTSQIQKNVPKKERKKVVQMQKVFFSAPNTTTWCVSRNGAAGV